MVSAPAKPALEAAKYWPLAAHVAARSSLPEANTALRASGPKAHSSIEVIRRRADFLAANRGKRFVTPGFVLLVHRRRNDSVAPIDSVRFGITVTKKIGNAVKRNRMKRRFRALLADSLPEYGINGADHILIGRKQDNEPAFSEMQKQLEKGLKHLAKKLEISG